MSREYDKLVRDRIPEIVERNGEYPVTRTVEGEEYRRRLREKLWEEATEFRQEGSIEEFADVLAVVDAIRDAAAFDAGELDEVRRRKREERGGFEDGIVLERVKDRPPDHPGE